MCEQPVKNHPTIACCGLDCGLCPRYYTVGISKCPGCCGPDFFNKHPSCSYITCCVKKKGLEVCPECGEFPCTKFRLLLRNEVEYDSFLTYKKVKSNLLFIQEHGLASYRRQQKNRIVLLEKMLEYFDDGRSKSFYCIAATLLPVEDLEASLEKAVQKMKAENPNVNDCKFKSKILKKYLIESATKNKIELRLRKKAFSNS